MTVEFDMSEVNDLAQVLTRNQLAAKTINSANLTRIAATLRDATRNDAPVDTGELRDSWKIAGARDVRIVYSDARQAKFVEFGTATMPPQPHLWPNIPAAEESMLASLEDIGGKTFD